MRLRAVLLAHVAGVLKETDIPVNTPIQHASAHDTPTDETLQDESRTPRGRKAHRSRRPKLPLKASYEASAEVQLWLKLQAQEHVGVKPEFTPTFLAHQRDRPWLLSSLSQFYEDDLITDVLQMVKSGKEASVYCCAAHPSTGADYLAAKVYRPRMFRGLRNDALYRESRALYDADGHEVRDRRHIRGAIKKTERGKAVEIGSWIRYEFETQRLLYEAGADVPKPYAQMGNAMLMEYVGVEIDAAPLLREVTLERDEANALFARVLRNVELFLACDRIHGDLSAYNVLYRQGDMSIIDFAQAVDPRYNLDVFPLLARDVERVCRYFARYDIAADAGMIARDLWVRYMGSVL
jgi:RIO kinase 1